MYTPIPNQLNRLFILLFFLIWIQFPATSKTDPLPDTLAQQMEGMPDSSRLTYLEELTKAHYMQPEYTEYINLYKEEAIRLKSKHHQGNAMIALGKYYYMEKDDELASYLDEIEPFLMETERKKEWVELCRLNLYIHTRKGKKQEVLDGVEELKKFSKEINYPEGEELANQNLAYFYFLNNMPEDGEKVYLDVLQQMQNRKAPLKEQVGILVQLFQFTPSPSENKMKYVEQAKNMLDEIKEDPEVMKNNYQVILRYDYSIELTYGWELIRLGELDKALPHMKKVEEMVETHQMEADRRIGVDQLYFDYYMALSNKTDNKHAKDTQVAKALVHLDKIIDLARKEKMESGLVHYLEQKASVLYEEGNYKDVVDIQKELMELNDSINKTGYKDRLADMRTRYEVDKLELEKQQIELEARQTYTQMMIWIGGCILLIFIVGGLIYVIRMTQKGRDAMIRAKEKAEEADQMKSVFLANMNHEIRTPLNAIVGFSQILVEEEDMESRRHFATIIENNNELLQQLISDVLDISKIESGTMQLVYSKQDLPVIMNEMYNMISLRVPENVKLILDPCESLTFTTDRNRLIQVITNLLTNAVKHTHSGHIRFGYNLTQNNILFYVEDTGEGIPKEQQESIFDRFTQLENGKKGAGLGLAISKGIITRMGGRIWVESEIGKGSTFFVQIPLNKG